MHALALLTIVITASQTPNLAELHSRFEPNAQWASARAAIPVARADRQTLLAAPPR